LVNKLVVFQYPLAPLCLLIAQLVNKVAKFQRKVAPAGASNEAILSKSASATGRRVYWRRERA
jgi:hypothetical protein